MESTKGMRNAKSFQWDYNDLKQDIPPMVVQPERLIFVALCNDLIDYFVVCFDNNRLNQTTKQ